jgi:hypothetical protein
MFWSCPNKKQASILLQGGIMETPKEFLNPSSMLTPGIAGAVAMTIANTLNAQFGFNAAVVALLCSFLIGLLVATAKTVPSWKKYVYYVFNSLVIFTMAVGSNTLGQVAGTVDEPSATISYLEKLAPEVTMGVAAAHADPPADGWCLLNKKVAGASRQECEKWGGRFFANHQEADQAFQAEESEKLKGAPLNRTFFKPWFGKKK